MAPKVHACSNALVARLAPADAAREAQVVADQRAAASLPADCFAFEQQRG
jgi:hypothetical protein